ncbi:MAG: hypothetical protein QOF20_3350, partial [Acidimicrobiaceae bacterium]|nr:hypothetical protein [Acidimicrobiaceae bacterium]
CTEAGQLCNRLILDVDCDDVATTAMGKVLGIGSEDGQVESGCAVAVAATSASRSCPFNRSTSDSTSVPW